MIALGIDPGTAICGFGVVALEGGRLRMVDAGVVRTAATRPMGPGSWSSTGPFARSSASTGPTWSRSSASSSSATFRPRWPSARRAASPCSSRRRHGLPIDEPTPNEVKLAVCGSGNADKRQVAEMVERLLGVSLAGVPDDATDALAAAIGAAYRSMSTARAVAR